MRRIGLTYGIYLIIIISIGNGVIQSIYQYQNKKLLKQKEDAENIFNAMESLNGYILLLEMNIRGYMLIQDDEYVSGIKYVNRNYIRRFNTVETLAESFGYDLAKISSFRLNFIEYLKDIEIAKYTVDEGNVDEALSIVRDRRENKLFTQYSSLEKELSWFVESELATKGEKVKFLALLDDILLIMLFVIGVPIMVFILIFIREREREQVVLMEDLDTSNRKYVFDNGKEINFKNERDVISDIIKNLQKAATFIHKIADGEFSVKWKGFDESDSSLNKDNIAGELIQLRNQMIKVRTEDERRIWTTEGLSKFSDIVRNHQHDINILSEKLVSEIVQYMNAKQGGLFIVNNDSDEVCLDLLSCYAFDRKKYLEKRIKSGEGLVGQCYREGMSTYLESVPDNYVNITSGLGQANPKAIVVVPMKNNDQIHGVLELASFEKYEPYQISFLEQLGEVIASALTSAKVNETTRKLLDKSKEQAEQMRAQEEEMRQNMEELQATQEQMYRKTQEYEEEIARLKQEVSKKAAPAV